ncbi:MAG TPA: DUF1178 family protein [Syntrophales bacterium]|nr:DUF1178 family protein [Syntrophales bacterium]
MIIYDLRCENSHRFEGWFHDRQAFSDQLSRQLITCPVCGSLRVEMAPSTVSIKGKNTRDASRPNSAPSPLEAMRMFHRYLDKNFDDVGARFAEVAMSIHHGDEEPRNIKGTTTSSDEETLRQEGVHFLKIPVPKFDS